jgi:hypothetical protein
MHVDHFDPRTRMAPKQAYTNLCPASSHCNQRKLNYWPSGEQQKAGFRLLNARQETDYDEQIVECEATGELIGLTIPAKFQIKRLSLNADFLCQERLSRTNALRLQNAGPVTISGDLGRAAEFIHAHFEMVGRMIPRIKFATFQQIGQSRGEGLIKSNRLD